MALPPSSPRLPSPPPPAEIQIGPKSPAGGGGSLSRQQQMEQQMDQTALDANAKRRIHPGTRAADFAVGPPLVPLNELDSAFQLQEHLAALHYFHTANNTQPITRETARTLAHAPPGTDRTLWLYELCRFLIAQCNSLIVGFLFDTPPCSAATCPEMRASEWQFLCAVHEQPKSCCAIDYCCHTLDWAANVVTNPKIFPSRFVFADPHDKSAAVKNLINVFRRLHRIFAHAWFQHRSVFWTVEGQTGLYVLFKTVCDMYDLLPAENYKLPPEAEGLETSGASSSGTSAAALTSNENIAAGTNGHNVPDNGPGVISVASINDRKAMGYGPSPGPIPMPSTSGNSNGNNAAGAGATAAATTASSNHTRRPGSGSGNNGLGVNNGDFFGAASDDDHNGQSVGRTNTRRHIRSSPSTGSAVTTVMEQDEEPPVPSLGGVVVGSSSNTNTSRIAPPARVLTPASHKEMAPSVTVQERRGDSPEPGGEGEGGGGGGEGGGGASMIVHHDDSEEQETQQKGQPEGDDSTTSIPDDKGKEAAEAATTEPAKTVPTPAATAVPAAAAAAAEKEEEAESEKQAEPADADKKAETESKDEEPSASADAAAAAAANDKEEEDGATAETPTEQPPSKEEAALSTETAKDDSATTKKDNDTTSEEDRSAAETKESKE